jgi:hypothetical protein
MSKKAQKMVLSTIEKHEGPGTYSDTLKKLKEITSRPMKQYIPILCEQLEVEYTDKTLEWRQNKIVKDCVELLGWNKISVYSYIPRKYRPHPEQSRTGRRNVTRTKLRTLTVTEQVQELEHATNKYLSVLESIDTRHFGDEEKQQVIEIIRPVWTRINEAFLRLKH